MTTDFTWQMGGKRFCENFYVDDSDMLRSESLVLGWHFMNKHHITLDFANATVKIPYSKYFADNELQTVSGPNHPPYQPYD
jgi:hypothetical protein